ncbi:MAG: DNA polymerase III subunit gamma/tau [Acidiferrobacteraceae bacterium]
MSYLVLARKWRPTNFEDVVGQEHVVRVLRNALDTGRVHHAFLFSGSRGTGKTTLARIVARCLNCETGLSARPCGTCSACQEIDQGRCVDLIEVDAASRTKVDDTRELLDNVQYAPTRGRYKVYLIDEVHMLSGHSFNALLKTLEEPPAHVKFLLATTDPQKLPATVLSRCLQFNLKRLAPSAMQDRLALILDAEHIGHDRQALAEIADAADGSLRDALSLLDQAIAYGGGEVHVGPVREMLGSIDRKVIEAILDALASGRVDMALAAVSDVAVFNADYSGLLRELLLALHDIAILQQLGVSDATVGGRDISLLRGYAERLSPEDTQLFYQIGTMGRRDLPFAPDERAGLEMTLMRMVAFRPVAPSFVEPQSVPDTSRPLQAGKASVRTTSEVLHPADSPSADRIADLAARWGELAPSVGASGMIREILVHSTAALEGNRLILSADPSCAELVNPDREAAIRSALEHHFGFTLEVRLQASTVEQDTPAKIQRTRQEAQLRSASEILMNDPIVRELHDQFGARINPASIKPKV